METTPAARTAAKEIYATLIVGMKNGTGRHQLAQIMDRFMVPRERKEQRETYEENECQERVMWRDGWRAWSRDIISMGSEPSTVASRGTSITTAQSSLLRGVAHRSNRSRVLNSNRKFFR